MASDISNDEDFLKELNRLSTSFGIGVIKINIDDPDFKEFLKRMQVDISSKEIRKEKYDKICRMEELIRLEKK